jgi:hypothetical protein
MYDQEFEQENDFLPDPLHRGLCKRFAAKKNWRGAKMRKFTLEITMGNDAMQTRDQLAYALELVADEVHHTTHEAGIVRDENGNTVGKWNDGEI